MRIGSTIEKDFVHCVVLFAMGPGRACAIGPAERNSESSSE